MAATAGLSLWLCPPKGSDLEKKLQKLIDETVPKHFKGRCPHFRPHITITSSIPTTIDPQTLISSISPSSLPLVIFKSVRVGTAYWTRTTLLLEKTPSFVDLAVECRAKFVLDGDYDAAKKWAETDTTPAESGEEGLIPHLSLVYSDEDVSEDMRERVEGDVRGAGIAVEEEDEGVSGWEGGRVLLVPTNKPMPYWDKPLAEMVLGS